MAKITRKASLWHAQKMPSGIVAVSRKARSLNLLLPTADDLHGILTTLNNYERKVIRLKAELAKLKGPQA